MRPGELGRRLVDFFQLTKEALNLREPREHRIVILRQTGQNLRGDFREAAAIARERVARHERLLLVGFESGSLDLADLVFEQVDLALKR